MSRDELKNKFIRERPYFLSEQDAEAIFDDWFNNVIVPLAELYKRVERIEMSRQGLTEVRFDTRLESE